MKVVILAGGRGTRISEETDLKPKPMVEIGGKPILWHIMKYYSSFNLNDFVICCGYKGYVIKEYFANYSLHMSDVTFDMSKKQVKVHCNYAEPWRVTLVDTGEDTMTGGRLKRIREYVRDETFCLTYGDGLSNVDVNASIDFHKKGKFRATVTAVQPPERYGVLELDGQRVSAFKEKHQGEEGWINGGFFVLDPSALDLVSGDSVIWERGPLEALAKERKLGAFKHRGFWQSMDTLRDRIYLESVWDGGKAPWKTW